MQFAHVIILGDELCSHFVNIYIFFHVPKQIPPPGEQGRGEETRSGTEKRCSHNWLQSGHLARWSADNSNTVKPVLSGHRIKQTPSIKRTVAEVPKFISLIYFK